VPAELTPEQGVELWADVMETCHQLLVAGLRASVGEGGNVVEAYRQWYEQEMLTHDRMIVRMAERFNQRQPGNDTTSSLADA
jgi:hypothetical protein